MNLDAAFAHSWLDDALASIESARESIDSLNVFPVPDSDTGTNVLHTLQAGARSARRLDESATVSQLARAFADGALWGARGNSGIIIAQSFQAVAGAFDGASVIEPVVLVRAFDAIALGARQALAEPVEGTMVTVASDVANAVLRLPPPLSTEIVVRAALDASIASLERTTELLPVLRETRQVDAGALCLVLLIIALARSVGIEVTEDPQWFESAARLGAPDQSLEGFEVMYIVRATHRDATVLRTRLNQTGTSVVVVGGKDQLWHVHVHLSHPSEALSDLPMSQVCVRSLAPGRLRAVAATSAPHLLEPLAAAGAVAVLSPGTDTFVRAVQDAGSREVTILPCSEESAQAAAVARDLAIDDGVAVRVGDSRDDLAVLDAAVALSATPEAQPSREIHRIDGTDPASITAATDAAAAALVQARPAVVTVLVGAPLTAHQAARRLTALVRAGSPHTETYVIPGGQPAPALLVSAV